MTMHEERADALGFVEWVSPYEGKTDDQWAATTVALIQEHPLYTLGIVAPLQEAWAEIFESSVGGLRIGRDFRPVPQVLGFLLEVLFVKKVIRHLPGDGRDWRLQQGRFDKDLVCVTDESASVEIKTSSDPRKVFGNRSYAKKAASGKARKKRSGYMLAINYQKWAAVADGEVPKILQVRFGWLDADDWKSQKTESGQAASLSPAVERGKLQLLELG